MLASERGIETSWLPIHDIDAKSRAGFHFEVLAILIVENVFSPRIAIVAIQWIWASVWTQFLVWPS